MLGQQTSASLFHSACPAWLVTEDFSPHSGTQADGGCAFVLQHNSPLRPQRKKGIRSIYIHKPTFQLGIDAVTSTYSPLASTSHMTLVTGKVLGMWGSTCLQRGPNVSATQSLPSPMSFKMCFFYP